MPIQAVSIAISLLLFLLSTYRLFTSPYASQLAATRPYIGVSESPWNWLGYETPFEHYTGVGSRWKLGSVRRELFLNAFFSLLACAFSTWFEWVVYCAYLYMKLCDESEGQQRDQHQLISVRATARECQPAISGQTGYYAPPPPGYQPVQQMGGGMAQGVYWQKGPQINY